jgi:hypothetical protein
MADYFRHRLGLATLTALLVLSALPAWAGQDLVYSQGPNYQNVCASRNDTLSGGFGNYAASYAYDNFTLGSATTFNQVPWVSGYINPQSPGSISDWTVSRARCGGRGGSVAPQL